MKLENFITLVSTKEVSSNIYISTDNMLPNFGGVIFNDLCPNIKGTKFKENDILLSNIRPYFKKLWYSNCNGVCSSDIVCIRVVNNDLSTKYLYYFLSSNRFFDRYVKGSIGSKMPRGNKNILLEFPITLPTMTKQLHIVDIMSPFHTYSL